MGQTIVRPRLNPAVILALQTSAFRFDWQAGASMGPFEIIVWN
jgi:hypothetical protein